MKYLSLLEAPSEKFVEIAVRKMGGDFEKIKEQPHPQEDFLIASKKYPIFIVADGVTLIQYIIDKKPNYPHPSPAGDAAHIFCEKALEAAEKMYASFEEGDIKKVFKAGNDAVAEYNKKHGRTKETIDYWDTDLYAATASLVVIKEDRAYWGSICDSYVSHFCDEQMLLQSPQCNSKAEAKAVEFVGDKNNQKERAKYAWRVRRNGVNEEGKRVGYGVITGEEEALSYVSVGTFKVQKGDLVAVFTDGFEEYLKLPEFISLFKTWPDDLLTKVKHFTLSKSEEDPDKFAHERSLIMISI